MPVKHSKEQLQLTRDDLRLQIAANEARESLIGFARFMMPDPEDQDNPLKSQYQAQPVHKLIAEALERVARGECLRLALSVPPQFGKSQLASRLFLSWFEGKFPTKDIIFATYSQDFANEFGGEVREFIQSPRYKKVFPKMGLRPGSKAKDLMTTVMRGKLAFIGRGGAGTGKSADLVVIDDPLKNAEEADSPTIRKALHDWFSKVIYSRVRSTTAIIIIHTRWHEDDLIGRLCDPEHPNHDPEAAKDWTYINIPAVLKPGPVAEALGAKLGIQTNDLVRKIFGVEPMASLWPKRFSLEHLATAARLDPVGFNALYMGRPTPEDGEYFKKEWFLEYLPGDLPTELRFYGASDHAVTEKTESDSNVIGSIGVDANDDIWVMPDLVWDRMQTDRIVEELLAKFQIRRHMLWWMEDENISKSFGPFLIKRMNETKIYTTLDPIVPSRDIRARARAIQGRMSMRKVHFPKFAPWWRDAQLQMLKFPHATHDDFVAWLALIGLGLTKEIKAEKGASNDNVIRTGTMGWIIKSAARRTAQENRRKAMAGW